MKVDLHNKDDRDGFRVLFRYWGWSGDYGDWDYADSYFDDENQPNLTSINGRLPDTIELNNNELEALFAAYREMQNNYDFLSHMPEYVDRVDALRNTDRFVNKLKNSMKAHRTTAPRANSKRIVPVASARKMIGTKGASLKKTVGKVPNFKKNLKRIL